MPRLDSQKTTKALLRPPPSIAKGSGHSVQRPRGRQWTGVYRAGKRSCSARRADPNRPESKPPIGNTRHFLIRSRLPLFRRPVRLTPQVSPVFP